jgi:hypothetical protein
VLANKSILVIRNPLFISDQTHTRHNNNINNNAREWGWIESESKISISDSLEIKAENRMQYVSEKSVEKKITVLQVIRTH